MSTKAKIVDPDEAWDARQIGAEEQFVEVAPDISKELDAALDLHPISIRLQKSLVDNLRALAHLHGLGYQPLIRQILTRWVEAELKQMVAQRVNAKVQEKTSATARKDEPKPAPAKAKKAA